MTITDTGTGNGTGTIALRSAAPGTDGDRPTTYEGDRVPRTAGDGPATTAGTKGPRHRDNGDQGGGWFRSLAHRRPRPLDRLAGDGPDTGDAPVPAGPGRSQDNAVIVAAVLERQRQATAAAPGQSPNARRRARQAEAADAFAKRYPRLAFVGWWGEAIFGNIPLAAPLIVSGRYTYDSFNEVLHQPWWIALLAAFAAEGGLFRLNRVYEKTLVEGDSTVGIRLGIGAYLAAISGLIYWNQHKFHGGDWRPSAVAAGMCVAGVYIAAKVARFNHRVELRNKGMVDAQAIRLSIWAWLFQPIATPATFKHWVKNRDRLSTPAAVVRDRKLFKAAGKPSVWPPLPSVLDGDGTIGIDGDRIGAALQAWGIVPTRSFPIIAAVPGTAVPALPAVPGTVPAVPVPPVPAAQVPVVPPQSSAAEDVPAVPAVPAETGTGDQPTAEPADENPMITLDGGKTIQWKTLLDYAQHHRVRLATFRGLEGAGLLWTCPADEVTGKAIKAIGGAGFQKQEIVCQMQKLILAERAGVDPYATV